MRFTVGAVTRGLGLRARARDRLASTTLAAKLWGRVLRRRQRLLKQEQSALLSKGTRWIELPLFGATFVIDVNEFHDMMLLDSVRREGAYEPETTRLLFDRLQTATSFADVGANNGYFTVLAARWLSPPGHIVAFEPNPRAVSRLHKNLAANGCSDRVVVVQAAVSDAPRLANLWLSRIEDGRGSLYRQDGSAITVQTVSLDSALGNMPPSLVKLDVEGSEHAALQGMTTILHGAHPPELILEWNQDYATADLFDLLTSTHDVFRVIGNLASYRLVRIDSMDNLAGIPLCNLFALPRRKTPGPST